MLRSMDAEDMAGAWRCLMAPDKRRNNQMLRPLLRWTLSVDLMHGMRTDHRREICKHAEGIQAKAGEAFLTKGTTLNGVYIVMSGRCRINLPALAEEHFAAAGGQGGQGRTQHDRAKVSAARWLVRPLHQLWLQLPVDVVAAAAHNGRARLVLQVSSRDAAKDAIDVAVHHDQERRRVAHHMVEATARNLGRKWLGRAKVLRDEQANHDHHHHTHHSAGTGEPAAVPRSASSPPARSPPSRGSEGKQPARRPADLDTVASAAPNDSAMSFPLDFGANECFGEHRSFHNVDPLTVMAGGYLPVSTTVTAMEDTELVLIRRPEDVLALKKATGRGAAEKLKYLRKHQVNECNGCSAILRRVGKTSCMQGGQRAVEMTALCDHKTALSHKVAMSKSDRPGRWAMCPGLSDLLNRIAQGHGEVHAPSVPS